MASCPLQSAPFLYYRIVFGKWLPGQGLWFSRHPPPPHTHLAFSVAICLVFTNEMWVEMRCVIFRARILRSRYVSSHSFPFCWLNAEDNKYPWNGEAKTWKESQSLKSLHGGKLPAGNTCIDQLGDDETNFHCVKLLLFWGYFVEAVSVIRLIQGPTVHQAVC